MVWCSFALLCKQVNVSLIRAKDILDILRRREIVIVPRLVSGSNSSLRAQEKAKHSTSDNMFLDDSPTGGHPRNRLDRDSKIAVL